VQADAVVPPMIKPSWIERRNASLARPASQILSLYRHQIRWLTRL